MNIILNNQNTVIWVNPHPSILSGKECWFEFDESKHKCFFLKGFIVNQNETIDMSIVSQVNDTLVFQSKVLYNKETGTRVIAYNYQDYKNLEMNFTDIPPIENEPFQNFDGEKWTIDTTIKEAYEKNNHNIRIKAKLDELDKKSIRSLREAIISGDNSFLIKHENDAKELRGKLK